MTYHKTLEQDPALTLRLLDTLLTRAPVGFVFLDRDLRFIRINDQLAEINGLDVEAHLGRTVSEILPSLEPTLREVTGRILVTGQAVLDHEFSGETPRVPGVTRNWNESWYPVHDDRDEIIGFGGIVVEITARKQTEAAARLANERLDAAVKASKVVLFQQDLELRYRWIVNSLPDFEPSEVIAHRDSDLMEHAEEATQAEAIKRKVIRCGIGARQDILIHTPQGARHFDLLVEPMRDAAGLITGITGAAIDITERKQIELDLLEATAAAEKANRAKSDFLASMSHELRTPLNSILGFAQLLEYGVPAPTPSQQQSIDEILRGGWYLAGLIDELLDLALIESGKLALTQEPVSLVEIMLECRAMIEPLAAKRGIVMTFPSVEPSGHVRADRGRVKQVLINLLTNAIKYNRAQGALTVEYEVKPTGVIRVSVRDTGMGLAPEKLALLFQPFNRLGKEGGPEAGTGIGLVMCKRLVELMGGTIGAESVVGVGSVFWFELEWSSAFATSESEALIGVANALPV